MEPLFNLSNLDGRKIAKEKLMFTVELGGMAHESIDSQSVNYSPQLRKVTKAIFPPGTPNTVIIPMFVVPSGFFFRSGNVSWDCFCNQGYEDLKVQLFFQNAAKMQSGKYEPTSTVQDFPQEVRDFVSDGAPFNAISSGGAAAFPDNFLPGVRQFAIAFEGDRVSFTVQNQSGMYDHFVRVYISGWFFTSTGRSKTEIVENIYKRYVQ